MSAVLTPPGSTGRPAVKTGAVWTACEAIHARGIPFQDVSPEKAEKELGGRIAQLWKEGEDATGTIATQTNYWKRWKAANPGTVFRYGRELITQAKASEQEQFSQQRVCPECGHAFSGNGWDGIDAHWRKHHEDVMPYTEAWKLIQAGTYKKSEAENERKARELIAQIEASIQNEEEEEEIIALEGGRTTSERSVLKRDERIVKRAKKKRIIETGKLECECCGFDFHKVYGAVGEGFIEAHHQNIQVSELNGQTTVVEDLAMVCSNCHRMIHKFKPMLKVSELREFIESNKDV